jgi:hypothetical protein
MKVIRNLDSATQITDPEIRQLVEKRLNDLGEEPFELDSLGYFIVVVSSASLEAVNAQLGFNILANRFTGIRYDQTGFAPSFEFVEQFGGCYDMVFVMDDSGFGIEVFISKAGGVNPELLALCERYATAPFPDDGPSA